MEHKKRSLDPDHPVVRGTSQNPDVFFQAREAANPYTMKKCLDIVQEVMDEFYKQTGRRYSIFYYLGHPEAERVIVIMGSGQGAVREAVEAMANKDEKVGVVFVRLYRPFSVSHFIESLPVSVKKIAVLDRTKEPGSIGEPLYQDVITALVESDRNISVIGGRYGLSSKEFTPQMVKGVFDELIKDKPKNHFTVGINDDVSHTSLESDDNFKVRSTTINCMFYGLGSDGTVGANKNSIKIIGETTDNYVQGYFVYDSKKAGAQTISHLRFGLEPIHSTYLIDKADFIASHKFNFIEKFDMIAELKHGGTFLLNSPYSKDEIWDKLPIKFKRALLKKKLSFM